MRQKLFTLSRSQREDRWRRFKQTDEQLQQFTTWLNTDVRSTAEAISWNHVLGRHHFGVGALKHQNVVQG
jgi:hypothetical protein